MASSQSVLIDTPNNALYWDRPHDNFISQKPLRHLDSLKCLHPPANILRLPGQEAFKKVENLEKAMQFVQSHHAEVLSSLHEEIDNLKRQNQELLLKVAMLQNINESSKSKEMKISTNLDAASNTSSKKCQTPRNKDEASMRKQMDQLIHQIKLLSDALEEEKSKVSVASEELQRLEIQNRRQSEEIGGRFFGERYTNSCNGDKIHSKTPLGMTYSLPAISKNQFVGNCPNKSKKYLEQYCNTDLNRDLQEEFVKKNSNPCRSMSLCDQSPRAMDSSLNQHSSKKSATLVQLSRINLAFSENPSLTSLGHVRHRRSEPKIRSLKTQGSTNQDIGCGENGSDNVQSLE